MVSNFDPIIKKFGKRLHRALKWNDSHKKGKQGEDRRGLAMGSSLYGRRVGEMLEDFGRRVESIMTHIYGSWEGDDWLTYPNLTGKKRLVNCAEWGNGDIGLHHKWLKHLPHSPRRGKDGKLNNWWEYVVNSPFGG
ncbi:MAG: hypothetical protein ACPLSK_06170 [bacterium]